MRTTILFVLLLGMFFPTTTAYARSSIRLRILCYNIHHAEGVDRQLDVERIARVIRSVKPDLVALQEVDQNVKRTQVVDQPARLAKLTEMRVVFGANIELQGWTLRKRYPLAVSNHAAQESSLAQHRTRRTTRHHRS